ncbi:hypothetical protein CDAR_494971 [Caerostris darwini]|uniref:Uncharacterized protein n=1 Tax=Caerostris darwini TaxID=1538125 RepID=A0AAV4RVW5_9ARAC|nr:hypothetical protein CDAR_494971 [Caerostris darwini]
MQYMKNTEENEHEFKTRQTSYHQDRIKLLVIFIYFPKELTFNVRQKLPRIKKWVLTTFAFSVMKRNGVGGEKSISGRDFRAKRYKEWNPVTGFLGRGTRMKRGQEDEN